MNLTRASTKRKLTVACIASFILMLPSTTHAWSALGHHIIAVMTYERMPAEQQAEMIRILKQHPLFEKDFKIPEGTKDPNHYIIGRAGCWPDIARSYPEWNRPTWHYQLAASTIVGSNDDLKIPDTPLMLPDDATLKTQELYALQALKLCKKILKSDSTDADRAIALCWFLHIGADIHQPCHAGSLYAPHIFPEGDRGANSIKTKQGRNLHALWDGLLGRSYDQGDLYRRMKEIEDSEQFLSEDKQAPLNEWGVATRLTAIHYLYRPEVKEPISVATRAKTSKMQSLTLSQDYLRGAGIIAQLQALKSARNVSAELKTILSP